MNLFLWIFVALIAMTMVGSLWMLLKTANKMPIDPEKMKLIKARKAEVEAQEAREKNRDER